MSQNYNYTVPAPTDPNFVNQLSQTCSVLGNQQNGNQVQKEYCQAVCALSNNTWSENKNQLNCVQVCQNATTQQGCVNALQSVYQNSYAMDTNAQCFNKPLSSSSGCGSAAVIYGTSVLPSTFQSYPLSQQTGMLATGLSFFQP